MPVTDPYLFYTLYARYALFAVHKVNLLHALGQKRSQKIVFCKYSQCPTPCGRLALCKSRKSFSNGCDTSFLYRLDGRLSSQLPAKGETPQLALWSGQLLVLFSGLGRWDALGQCDLPSVLDSILDPATVGMARDLALAQRG